MGNRPASFTQADLTRALKAAQAAGLPVGRIEIEPGGRIVVIPGKVKDAEAGGTWDDVLQ